MTNRYALEAGRLITRDSEPFVSVIKKEGVSPSDVDWFARRVVACVNACAGISTGELELMGRGSDLCRLAALANAAERAGTPSGALDTGALADFERLQAAEKVLRELVAWAQYMGGFEAPVWDRAEAVLDACKEA